MDAFGKCAPSGSQTTFGLDGRHDGFEVTTVFEAVRRCPASLLASQLLLLDSCLNEASRRGAAPSADGIVGHDGAQASVQAAGWIGGLLPLVTRRAASMLSLLQSIGPNLERSALNPVDPASQDSLRRIAGHAWQDVLGMRMLVPRHATDAQLANRLCRVILVMSYL